MRDDILKFIKRELIGPDPVKPHIQENGEEILINEPPRLRYGAGILFPRAATFHKADSTSSDEDKVLEKITFKDSNSGEEKSVSARALFIYIGAKPGTSWLNNTVHKDDKGYILTGSDLTKEKSFNIFWKLERKPYLPETSVPGIFASGDVRSTALTGISSAVGEGAMAIRFVRKYLEEI